MFDPACREVRTSTHCEVEGPSFLATITSVKSGKRDRAAMIRCAYELRHYLLVAKDVTIEHIQMMCPPSLNGKNHWTLEDLEKIVVFRGVERSQSAVIYQTSVATYKLGDLDLRRKKKSQVLYADDHRKTHVPQLSNGHMIT